MPFYQGRNVAVLGTAQQITFPMARNRSVVRFRGPFADGDGIDDLALLFGLLWWWNRGAKKWLEENGRVEELPRRLDWLVGDGQQKPGTTLKYSEQEFQELVVKALDEIPEEFDKEWENVAVIVSTEWPTDVDKKRMGVPQGHLVFGTYSGLDRTKGFRSGSSSRHVIVIYQPALELRYGSDKDRLEQEIRRVVLHELAHHLGMSHPRMKEIGL